jgi:acyl-CoA synthetase (AMP-forming)/AMP-acid ligase II
MLGSAPVRRPFLERLQRVISPGTVVRAVYGMTEAAPVASVTLGEKLAFTGEGDLLGTCFPGVRARIADDGELWVSGRHLFRGYLGGAPVVEHATGDLARLDECGRLVLLGRRKDMIIRGQFNVYPDLYESRIEAIPGVRRCAMVGVYDEAIADERIVLALEPDQGQDAEALKGRVLRELRDGKGRIDEAAQPDLIIVLEVPVAGRAAKIDRQALRAIAEERLCASR